MLACIWLQLFACNRQHNRIELYTYIYIYSIPNVYLYRCVLGPLTACLPIKRSVWPIIVDHPQSLSSYISHFYRLYLCDSIICMNALMVYWQRMMNRRQTGQQLHHCIFNRKYIGGSC